MKEQMLRCVKVSLINFVKFCKINAFCKNKCNYVPLLKQQQNCNLFIKHMTTLIKHVTTLIKRDYIN